MKKLFAIILGLALTLGLATVASAAFNITGQLVVGVLAGEFESDLDYFVIGGPVYHNDTRVEIALTGTYGDISGDAKFRLKPTNMSSSNKPFEFREGKVMYRFSDEFKLGVASSSAGTVYYTSPVDGDEWKYFDTWIRADLAFGDFSAILLGWGEYASVEGDSGLALDSGGKLEYALDPFTFYLPYEALFVTGEGDTLFGFDIQPCVKYQFTDEFYVAGELDFAYAYANIGGLSDSDSELFYFAVGADYESDLIHAYGSFDYDLVDEELAWWIAGLEYNITEAITLYGEYESLVLDDTYVLTLGAEWDMNGDGKSILVAEVVVDSAIALDDDDLFQIPNDTIIVKWTLKF